VIEYLVCSPIEFSAMTSPAVILATLKVLDTLSPISKVNGENLIFKALAVLTIMETLLPLQVWQDNSQVLSTMLSLFLLRADNTFITVLFGFIFV
jgi:hypothetical protein